MRESRKYILEVVSGIFIIIGVIFYAFYFRVDDLKNVRRAETTLIRLEEIRVALEKFYQETGSYPDLIQEGAEDNLQNVVGINKKGDKIYFSEIYGREKLSAPLSKKGDKDNNKVYDVQDFKEGITEFGGWNYNYKEQTGEIHANLEENYYQQGIIWFEE